MNTETRSSKSSSGTDSARQRRRLRNFLLEPRFQLKYTGMVMAVTGVVASGLGWVAWRIAREVSRSFEFTLHMNPPPDPEVAQRMQEMVRLDDDVAFLVSIGVVVLMLALGIVGIVITHRVVGPVYKMRLLLGKVAEGPTLKVAGGLRRGDELQALHASFADMVESLHASQLAKQNLLDDAVEKAIAAGIPTEALELVVRVRDQIASELE